MAVTKIHAIKKTVDKSIAYICNVSKTDGALLISSFGCSPETAALDFAQALQMTGDRKGGNLAYHLIQSFAPGEVDPEKAHEIGKALADRILGVRHSYVCATHVDKDHVHSHIIFCAADNLEPRKYNDCRESYRKIRSISDELCKEQGLSILKPSKSKGQQYAEWQARKEGNSWKSRVQKDIDSAIRASSSYIDFLNTLKAMGYEIKGEGLEISSPKYISFRPPGKERFVRGTEKSLGAQYTKQRIAERINCKEHSLEKGRLSEGDDHLINTTAKRFMENPYLKRWATLHNLKFAAEKYNEIESLTGLAENLADTSAEVSRLRDSLVTMDRQLKDLAEIVKYARQYKNNLPLHLQYMKAADKDTFLQKHESSLILFDGAKAYLCQKGIDLKNLNPAALKIEFSRLSASREQNANRYHQLEMQKRKLHKKLNEIASFLGLELPVQSRENECSPDLHYS